MTGGAQSRRNNKPSINYRYNPHEGAKFDLVDVTCEDYAPSSRDSSKQPAKQAEPKSSHVISTGDLISGASHLWNFATSSLPVLRHRTTSFQNSKSLQKENTFYYPAEEGNIIASISSEGQNVSVNLKTDTHVSPTVDVKENFKSLRVAKKISSFDGCSENHIYHHLLRCLHNASGTAIISCNEKRVSSVTILYKLENIYRWMNTTQILKQNEHDTERTDYCCNVIETDGLYRRNPEAQESLQRENASTMIKTSTALDSCVNSITESQYGKEDELHDTKECQESQFVNQEKEGQESQFVNQEKEGQESQLVYQENSSVQMFSSSAPCKPQYGFAKQEHAFAGAFAGIFVSLCLHPMDTVKTVVQSCGTDQRSVTYIGKSIISERGLSGLYRGISSNIASSAPISAIYTFSYESVKGALLPLFAKEYHSLVHCIAGGCASVATSFVFTPSERIKQQMQVGSHYHSCWNALLGIVGKGGFLSLYNGWGAVLCRNVPHSVIKFYTYESLKNGMFKSHEAHAQPTTISTLLCGGLAGSTASLFTTPFDVVKTRLQTQIPGSANQYHGVYNTLRDIAQHEGLKGLYRGLTPRLAMYMTQGALFFASYESFKRLFSVKATPLEYFSKGS